MDGQGIPNNPEALSKQQEERYENILNAIPDIVYRIDPEGRFSYLNQSIQCLGYTPQELIGKSFSCIIHPEDLAAVSKSVVLPHFKGKKTGYELAPKLFDEQRGWSRRTQNLEVRLIAKKNSEKTNSEIIGSVIAFGEISAVGFYQEPGKQERKFLGTVGIIRDITERRKAETLLRKLYSAVDQIPLSVIITDNSGTIEYINPKFLHVSGFLPDELLGHNVRLLKSGHHTDEFYTNIKVSLRKDLGWKGEILNKNKKGDFYWEYMTISPLKNPGGTTTHYIAIKEDITEKKKTAEQVKSLKEKDVLLSEIHHRVKNNLQVITSLLNIQMDYICNDEDKKVFRECQNRIKSMALIHEKLYYSQDMADIDFSLYLQTLATELLYSYNILPGRIKLNIKADGIFLDISTATPLGLIVNELITNSLKHAFDDVPNNEIMIEIKSSADQYTVCVGDNGKGLPKEIDFLNTNTLGLQLVMLLTRQLQGRITLDRSRGTRFTIVFPRMVKEGEGRA